MQFIIRRSAKHETFVKYFIPELNRADGGSAASVHDRFYARPTKMEISKEYGDHLD